jgi:pyruvate carboxylase
MNIKKVLVANRGEIAIRVLRACYEVKLRTVAIYTYEDRYSRHRFKADESYQIGADDDPLKPYLDIDEIVKLAKSKNVDAIHPGYGFLSENTAFARKCAENGIIFIGPDPDVMDKLGNKINAKEIAKKSNVPIIESNEKPLTNADVALEEAARIGYPVMVKAASGGGGRGMRVVYDPELLPNEFNAARNEAKTAFGDDTIFIEKFVANPKHIEIQIMADNYGNIVHLYERDCSVQRRYQKVVEIAPSLNLSRKVKDKLYQYAIDICKSVNYNNLGTVEFLVEGDDIYFIEVNPRIQVEHTVTEMVTGRDLVKGQIFIAGGYRLGDDQIRIPSQDAIQLNGFAIQCRITTEDPLEDFKPDYGKVTTYRTASGFGIRLDAGSIYTGVRISPFFDSMLVKVTSHSSTLDAAVRKLARALIEFRIRGVKTNIQFLDNIINHETFIEGKATVNFIKEHPQLFEFPVRRDRATKTIRYLGEVTVNGNPDVKVKDPSKKFTTPRVPEYDMAAEFPKGTKDLLNELGPEKFAAWLRNEKKVYYTDTTFRDAHQSLLATRIRSYDMLKVAESFAKNHPETFSMEVWGGATFDVCLRFLQENPWRRLEKIRNRVPNILLQMLIRGSNAVGYTAYPNNLIERFVIESWEKGIDVFRIFDSLNWLKAMEATIDYVRNKTGGIAEVSMCYTGDILNPERKKYSLDYYLQLAKDIENAGAHILAIKDMAGLLKPYAAKELITALKETIDLPIHLHTHDTSALQHATYLKAIEAGVNVVDVAMGGLSGLTSQPNFNSIVEMMRFHERENKMDISKLNQFSNYWEAVREYYYPFESGLKAGTAEVFNHEIPGGQYSNLKPQMNALGLADQFDEVKQVYGEVNKLFGDIVKVTPSSKVVGDMALYLVTNKMKPVEVLEKGDTISWPESVQAFFRGDLGQPIGGLPQDLQKIILKDKKPYTDLPNEHLEPVDFDKEFKKFRQQFVDYLSREPEITDFLSYKLYPKVYEDYMERLKLYGNISKLPTLNFFYGMKENEEVFVEIAPGKTIIVQLLSIGPPNDEGYRTVFFRVNGQPRNIDILDQSLGIEVEEHEKVDPARADQVGSPLQGLLSKVLVKTGEKVKKNQPLFVIEAMKMETTITAIRNAEVASITLPSGTLVNSDDLVLTLK